MNSPYKIDDHIQMQRSPYLAIKFAVMPVITYSNKISLFKESMEVQGGWNCIQSDK